MSATAESIKSADALGFEVISDTPANDAPFIASVPRDPAKPVALPLKPENIPLSMRERRQWVVWNYQLSESGKWTKVPYTAGSTYLARTNDPKTFREFGFCLNQYRAGKADGIGYVFFEGDGLAGIDLDHCFDGQAFRPEAKAIIDKFEGLAYFERSVGGDGGHLIVRGDMARSGKGSASEGLNWIEGYDHSSPRYFTFSGHRWDGISVEEPQEAQEALNWFHDNYLKQAEKVAADGTTAPVFDPADEAEDDRLIAGIRKSPRQGEKFTQLFDTGNLVNPDTGECKTVDQSALDMILVELLAFFCSRDEAQMDRIFRRSALMRDKWDEQRGKSTYGEMTIAKGIKYNLEHGGKALKDRLNKPKPTGKFRLTHVSELLLPPEPLRWTIKEFVLPESLVFLIGPPAAGKSLVAIDWAASVATGEDWHGRKVCPGAVIYLAGEGHFGIRRRLMAWQCHTGISLKDAPFAVSDTGASLTDDAGLAAVAEAIDAFTGSCGKPALIVVDTLHRNFGAADENSAQDMGAYFSNLDTLRAKYQCSIVTVHHTGHMSGDRGRGSSAIRAAVDTELSVSPTSEGSFKVGCQKMKDAPKPKECEFEITKVNLPWLDEDGFPEESVTIKPGTATNTVGRKPMPKSVRYALQTLVDAIQAHGDADKRVSAEYWRTVFYRGHTGDSLEAKKKAFQRARNDLIAGRAVTVIDDIYAATDCLNAEWSDARQIVLELQDLHEGFDCEDLG